MWDIVLSVVDKGVFFCFHAPLTLSPRSPSLSQAMQKIITTNVSSYSLPQPTLQASTRHHHQTNRAPFVS